MRSARVVSSVIKITLGGAWEGAPFAFWASSAVTARLTIHDQRRTALIANILCWEKAGLKIFDNSGYYLAVGAPSAVTAGAELQRQDFVSLVGRDRVPSQTQQRPI